MPKTSFKRSGSKYIWHSKAINFLLNWLLTFWKLNENTKLLPLKHRSQTQTTIQFALIFSSPWKSVIYLVPFVFSLTLYWAERQLVSPFSIEIFSYFQLRYQINKIGDKGAAIPCFWLFGREIGSNITLTFYRFIVFYYFCCCCGLVEI